MPRLQGLTCPNCGAKLRWNGAVSVVECRYCEAHVAVETGTRTDRPTEAISIPAPRRGLAFAIAGGLVIVAAIASSFVIAGREARTASAPATPAVTSTVAQVVATPLAATAQQVAAHHRVSPTGLTVEVTITGSPFQRIRFTWDRAHPDHVHEISLVAEENANLADVIARARAVLGRRLRDTGSGSHQFSGGSVSASIQSTLYMVSRPSSPRWKESIVAIWNVATHAAFDVPLAGDATHRHELLDLGYPLSILSTLALDTPIEAAATEVARVAPNVVSDGPQHRLMIDHPMIESATLAWDNRPAGPWTSIVLYFPVELSLSKLASPLMACLAPAAGEPKKLVADHLAGTFTLQYPAKGGVPWIDVGAQTIQIYPHYSFGDRATPDGLARVLAALADCRG